MFKVWSPGPTSLNVLCFGNIFQMTMTDIAFVKVEGDHADLKGDHVEPEDPLTITPNSQQGNGAHEKSCIINICACQDAKNFTQVVGKFNPRFI